VRSQIDYQGFILKLLKEEHKQLGSKALVILPDDDKKVTTAKDLLQVRMDIVKNQVDFKLKQSII